MATEAVRSGITESRDSRAHTNVVGAAGGVSAALAGAVIMGQDLWDIVVPGPIQEGLGESAVHCTWCY
jgi:hypothetical protein